MFVYASGHSDLQVTNNNLETTNLSRTLCFQVFQIVCVHDSGVLKRSKRI